ncbi:D-alanyl-D-alanine carboxypeptidase [Fervidicella metallireducens AeB]|uniref:serine-type D-Ala-D-Ala carboxypeptidase n=1 Tax=Fervidicella metallireducens AeB TaxID=1403537 RepID=A0A017RTH3_9CLOT|nr:D-alanyl-D-alanine carboxypeptidase family protein [Fervidicella metallireducens]EYE87759.1 D-alanyl-D-alanine carboxypeptidase [Fervidicella metallireducens AeB]
MKKYLSILLLFIFITIPIGEVKAKDTKIEGLDLNCKSALLMEFSSGKIIFEKNPHEKLAPASVTKIMTMLLVMEAVDSGKIKLTDKVTVSANAKSLGGSTMCLDEGEIRTVEELLKGVAIASANDGALALGEFIGGTEEEFTKLMNERAKQLGMNDTHFVNCYGFYDPNHYTSAYDIAIMSRELLKHKKILNYTTIWMETISEGRKEPITLANRNKLVRFYKGCDGLKTGYTSEAKYCISATAKRGDIRFISVILGADTLKNRNYQASKLLDYGFAKYESAKFVTAGEAIQDLKLSKAKPDAAKAIAKDDINLIYEKGNKPNVQKRVEVFQDVKLPLKKGDVVGIVKVVDGEKILGKTELVIDRDVNKMSLADSIKKVVKNWLNLK